MEALTGSNGRAGIDPESGMAINSLDLASYLKTAASRFKILTGRETAGVPVAVTLTVNVRDKSLQTASANYVAFVELPLDRVQQKLKEAAARAVPRATTQRALTGSGDSENAARMDALERRVQSLEAKIDLLTKLLGDKQK